MTIGSPERRLETPADVLLQIQRAREDRSERAALVELLHDAHPVHQDRSAADVLRLRAFVMQAFGELGLPDSALPYVLGELESSRHAEGLAAAARALRGGEPSPEYRSVLERAAEVARERDEYVSFASYEAVGSSREGVIASAEIETTLAWISEATRAEPSRCCAPPPREAAGIRRIEARARASAETIAGSGLQDQSGALLKFGELLIGQPSIVAFFYTRCENPTKCSLTMAKLARVQALLERRGIAANVAVCALTYDPGYDTPARLRAYAAARGFKPSEKYRVLRAVPNDAELSAYFDCGVSRVGGAVSRHRIELFVLDSQGRIAVAFEQRAWDPARVVLEASNLLERPRPGHGLGAALSALALALLPKCPLCWVGYASAFGIAGLETFGPWSRPLLAALVILSAGTAWRRARRLRWYLPFAWVALGTLSIVVGGLGLRLEPAISLGAVAIFAGVVLSAWGPRLLWSR